MRTTIELPESVYQHSEQLARLKRFSVEQFVVQVLERAFEAEPPAQHKLKPVSFPLIRSNRPGTLDVTDFNFDDLLA